MNTYQWRLWYEGLTWILRLRGRPCVWWWLVVALSLSWGEEMASDPGRWDCEAIQADLDSRLSRQQPAHVPAPASLLEPAVPTSPLGWKTRNGFSPDASVINTDMTLKYVAAFFPPSKDEVAGHEDCPGLFTPPSVSWSVRQNQEGGGPPPQASKAIYDCHDLPWTL